MTSAASSPTRGYGGHNAPESHKFRVFTSGQKRRVTPATKRQMRRRSAVESVIGHIEAKHRMDRNYSPASKATPSTPSWPPPTIISSSCSGG
ncbi:hypothetical protein AJ88_28710 [Mesorhizobium amorphae CCBAU 01583]|nr:hypothetical protein AJ88_28710 [Mesorhizobium amorphae CCBAU 01583]